MKRKCVFYISKNEGASRVLGLPLMHNLHLIKIPLFVFMLFIFCQLANSQRVRHYYYYYETPPEENAGNFIYNDGLVLDSVNGYTSADSVMWNQLVYQSDTRGNRTLASYYSFNRYDPKTLKPIRDLLTQYEYAYDEKGNMNLSFIKLPDEPYLMKTEYLYNKLGQLYTELYTRTFDSLEWENSGKLEIFYNNKGQVSEELSTAAHDDTTKQVFEYDAISNRLIQVKSEFKRWGKWLVDNKTDFYYNEANLLKLKELYQADSVGNYHKTFETAYIYEDTFLVEKSETGYGENSVLNYCYKSIYKNTSGEKRINEKKLENNVWVDVSEKVISLNDQGQTISSQESIWTGGKWVGLSKQETRYENSKPFATLIYYQDKDEWKLNAKNYYFYSLAGEKTGIEPHCIKNYDQEETFCYASFGKLLVNNPGENALIKLYSMDGKMLISANVKSGINIIEMGQIKGFQIVSLHGAGKVKVQKVYCK